MLGLYIILPLLLAFKIIDMPLWLVLLIMGLSSIFFLYHDGSFDKKTYTNWKIGKKYFIRMFLFFILSAVVMIITIWFIDSTKLFIFIKEDPLMLVKTAVIYPLFSVVPQELAYRSFFHHRYGRLFPSKWMLIIVSGFFFGFGHIIYQNPLVVFLTFVSGSIFAYRYEQSKSLLLTVIEHTFYGMWLFISGLGVYFISDFL